MTKTKFQQFCKKYNYQLQLIETLTIILVFCLLFYVVAQHYFLQYKVVLVEETITGQYDIVKEIIVNGQISDPLYTIDTTIPEHNGNGKFILDSQNTPFLYNIST